MRHHSSTFLILAVLAFTGYQAGGANTPVAPHSDTERPMVQSDANGRALLDAPVLSKTLQDYEATHGGNCTNVSFAKFQKTSGYVSPHVLLYAIEGVSPTCGTRVYHVQITFGDPANTVASEVKILFGPEDESNYQRKAMGFIRYAQSGDLKQMLAITSSLSRAIGNDSVRTAYRDHVIPAFQGTDVTWDVESRTVTDEKGNPGLMFTGTARGKKTRSFDVAVFKENGALVVASIQNHH